MRISDWSSDVCSSDLSGPLLDRVDLQIALPPAEPGWVDLPEGEPSAAVRQRVLDCRARQWRRQEITNARLGPDEIQAFCPLDQEGKNLLAQAMERWSWSARAVPRSLRVDRPLADMVGQERIGPLHIADAHQQSLTSRQGRGGPFL